MRNKKFPLFIFTMILGISLLFFWTKNHNSRITRIPIEITDFTNQPAIKVEIEGVIYNLLLDLGVSTELELGKDKLGRIQSKKWTRNTKSIDATGNVYIGPAYKVPKAKIGTWEHSDVEIAEENNEFLSDNTPIPHLENVLARRLEFFEGKLGRDFFRNTSCLFDFHNSCIYVAKQFSDLRNIEPIRSNDFVEVKFSIEDFGIIFFCETDFEAKKFILDSGASCSMLKDSYLDEKSKQLILKPTEAIIYYSEKFGIGGHDFAPVRFHFLRFGEIWDIDGLLGMDFLQKHAICLDFTNNIAYIQKTPSDGPEWPNK